MKKLILMRHGKSSWKETNLSDFDRPLKKRGQRDVPLMAKLLQEEELVPELILSSPAARCRETVALANESFGLSEEKIIWIKDLYMADAEDYLEALEKYAGSEKTVMICGHNPSLEGLLQVVTGNFDALSTAGVAYLKLDIHNWKDVDADDMEGKLKCLWCPKEINE
jgi:phosphohistidine phosphatase